MVMQPIGILDPPRRFLLHNPMCDIGRFLCIGGRCLVKILLILHDFTVEFFYCDKSKPFWKAPLTACQPRRTDFFEPMFAFANEATKKSVQRRITGC
jgi:hypothetical protein